MRERGGLDGYDKKQKKITNEIKLKAPPIIRKKLNTVSFCYLLFAKTKEQI